MNLAMDLSAVSLSTIVLSTLKLYLIVGKNNSSRKGNAVDTVAEKDREKMLGERGSRVTRLKIPKYFNAA